ncbi:GrpB family protein [Methylobacterium goesingense]|uniref:GrpB family protein n=1 Tax=Methylobacterium goesingense TaxID=243690 RepID=UPI001EE27AA3|nr:GrpB family protein [Methylobacterium goesingense]
MRRALGPALPTSADIRHVGATAIPGCLTKGDLDLVVRVDAADFPAAEVCLAARFARNAGSIRTEDFAAFADDGQPLPLGIQLTVKGGPFDVFHHFADALRGDAGLLERYNALKTRCDGLPMDAYRDEKSRFIAAVLRRLR